MLYGIMSILGLALVAAPFALGYSTNPAALWSSVIIGAVVALAAGYKALANDRRIWEDVVVIIAGVAALIMPFVLGFSTIATALWAFVILGVAAVLLSGYDIYATRTTTS